MAGRAVCSQSAEMWIVFLVTGNTCLRRFRIRDAAQMAVRAGDGGVLSLQPVIRKGVIERCRIQTDNVGGASFMLGVAGLALRFANVGKFPMKPSPCENVGINVVVTLPAKP